MSNTDQFVDEVYSELEKLYGKDQNMQKGLLGTSPMTTIFKYYSDWLANNLALSPRVAANAIYKDVIGVQYRDFENRKLKKGIQLPGERGFNFIYGSQPEIDKAIQIMTQLKNENPNKYNLILSALEKIKTVSDEVKPAKNIFGKTTNVAKQQTDIVKMPRLGTLETFLKLNDAQLKNYIGQLNRALKIK
jgi:hypothetical protein